MVPTRWQTDRSPPLPTAPPQHHNNSLSTFGACTPFLKIPTRMPVTRAVPPQFPPHHTTKGPRVLQHALIYEMRQNNLGAEVHSTALATPDNHTSTDRTYYGSRLTQEQKQILTGLFARCIKPTTRTKHDLAKDFGVTRDKIDVSYVLPSARRWALLKLTAKNWYQNQRTISRRTTKRKPQGARTSFASPSESHTISDHPRRDTHRRTAVSYAANPDSNSEYSNGPGPDKMQGIACAPSRTGSREFFTNADRGGSECNMHQQQLTTGIAMDQAPAMLCHNASHISGVQSNTVSGQTERLLDHIRQPRVSIEGVSSVTRPALSHACSTRPTHRDNAPYLTASEALVFAETSRGNRTRSEAKHPTVEPPVDFYNFTKRGPDFFPASVPL